MQEKDVVAFLEVAGTMDKYDAKKIREKLNITKEKYSSIKTYCLGKGLLLQLRVTSEGLDYILRYKDKIRVKKEEARIRNISYFFQAITIAILLITTCSAIQNASSAERSANAAEKSANYSYLSYQAILDALIPNTADIVLSSYDDTIFDQRDLIANKPLNEFQICVKNRGRMDSGQVKLNFVNERDYFPADDTTFYIEEVPADGKKKCTETRVRHHLFRKINESSIPTGNTTLKLRIYCPDCDKNKVQYHNIPICIRNSTHPC